MGLASALGTDWAGLVAEWCLGSTPGFTLEQAENAFSVLERLWPERVAELRASPRRGALHIGSLVYDGLVIASCEPLPGFAPVMARVRIGERPAFSELQFAAALVTLGYRPALEPRLQNRVPDTAVDAEGRRVYCEVIAPDASDVMQEISRQLDALVDALASDSPGMCVEVYLAADLTASVAERVLAIAQALPPSTDVKDMADVGLIRKALLSLGSGPVGIVPPDAPLPVFGAAQVIIGDGVPTNVNVCLSLSDSRAARLMDAEAKHFSRHEANLLVMDLTRVHGQINGFVPLIQRRFQPGLNRRFSAVALFSEAVRGNGTVMSEWRVLPNPYADVAPPQSLLEALRSMSGHPLTG